MYSGGPRQFPNPTVCSHYLSINGCRYGNTCKFKHVQVPSMWQPHVTYSNTRPNAPPVYLTQLSAAFVQFIQYFSYPNYLHLTSFDVLEIKELFPYFNEFDWKVILEHSDCLLALDRSRPNLVTPHRFEITSICIFLFEILTVYKSSNPQLVHNWKELFHALCAQNMLSPKIILSGNDVFHKEMFTIYASNQGDKDGKLALLSYTFRAHERAAYTPLYPALAVPRCAKGARYKFILNERFNFLSLKQIPNCLADFGSALKLYPSKPESQHWEYFSKSKNMVEELIVFYLWNDYYVRVLYEEIGAYFGMNHNDLFEILKLYVIDMEDDYMNSMQRLLMDKERLWKYIKAIDSFQTNIPQKDRSFWKKYLRHHRITEIFYK